MRRRAGADNRFVMGDLLRYGAFARTHGAIARGYGATARAFPAQR
ncbi:hypothetical protein FH063_001491 [Azospirillum argentinense]|uniref:Uncharacterized protein n=1 Tax=Azospirillum argentinense TaxID=2970906 RepID=A0A5B0L030_9PROT|nr:hypothetical protein FH063_001491 [Azospirillum argentinense]